MRSLLLPTILFTTLLVHTPLHSQDLPWFTQYREYFGMINPAAMSSDYITSDNFYNMQISSSYRHEGIAGFQEVPRTYALQGSWISGGPYERGSRILVGGHLLRDQFGPTSFTGGFARLAVFLSSEPEYGMLSAGFTVGGVQYRVNTNRLALQDNPTEVTLSQLYPTIGFGMFYRKQTRRTVEMYGGFSVPQLFSLDLNQKDDDTDKFAVISWPQIYSVAGAYFYTSSYAFVEPSIWIKYQAQTGALHLDANLRYQFPERFWMGAGVGLGVTKNEVHSAHLEFGIFSSRSNNGRNTKPYLKIGLGFDYYFSKLPVAYDTSLEINIAYVLRQR